MGNARQAKKWLAEITSKVAKWSKISPKNMKRDFSQLFSCQIVKSKDDDIDRDKYGDKLLNQTIYMFR